MHHSCFSVGASPICVKPATIWLCVQLEELASLFWLLLLGTACLPCTCLL